MAEDGHCPILPIRVCKLVKGLRGIVLNAPPEVQNSFIRLLLREHQLLHVHMAQVRGLEDRNELSELGVGRGFVALQFGKMARIEVLN